MGKRKPEPVKTAREAAEAIRQLNHDTLNIGEMSAPEISSTVRALIDMVDRLPQTFEQLAGHLEKQQAAGRVRMEDGRDAAPPVTEVVSRLREAAGLTTPEDRIRWGDPAGPLSAVLHEAGGWLFNMGAPWSEEEEEADGGA